MIVRELFARLGLNVDDKAFTNAEKKIAKVSKGLAALVGAGAAVTTGVAAMTRQMANAGDEIDKTSQQLGIGRRELQEYRHVANMSGVANQSLAKGLSNLTARARDAVVKGTGPAADALRSMGVSSSEAADLMDRPGDMVEVLADRFAELPDGAEKASAAMALFGRNTGPRLLPLLNEGTASIRDMRREADELGGIMSDESIDAAVAFQDAIARLRLVMVGLRNEIAGPFLANATEMLGAFSEWVRANREVIASSVEGVVAATVSATRALTAVLWPLLRLLGWVARLFIDFDESGARARWTLWALVGAVAAYNLGLAVTNIQQALAGKSALMLAGGALKAAGALLAAAGSGLLLLGVLLAKALLVAAVVLGFVILGQELWRFFTGASNIFSELGFLIQEFAIWAWFHIRRFLSRMWDGFKNALSTVGGAIADAVRWWIGLWVSLFTSILDRARALPGQLLNVLATIGEHIRDRVSQYRDMFVGLVTGIIDLFRELPREVMGVMGDLAFGLGNVPVIGRFFGGGESPQASAANSPSSVRNTRLAQRNTLNQTVTATPGMSAQDVAGFAREQFEDFFGGALEEADDAVGGA